MKIELSASIIKYAINTASVINKDYEDITNVKNGDRQFSINDIKAVNRKWGSISKIEDNIIFEIKDELLVDCMMTFVNICKKFIPIASLVKSMILMVKNYIGDVKEIVKPLAKKYSEEYEYTVEEINLPGINVGFMTLRRVRGETDWECVGSYVRWCDEFADLEHSVYCALHENIEKTQVEEFNEAVKNGTRTNSNNFMFQGDAEEVMHAKVEKYYINDTVIPEKPEWEKADSTEKEELENIRVNCDPEEVHN